MSNCLKLRAFRTAGAKVAYRKHVFEDAYHAQSDASIAPAVQKVRLVYRQFLHCLHYPPLVLSQRITFL